MKKSRGFSLIEMLIVLSIILILLVTLQNRFKPKNIWLYNGQKCVNDLYGIINNFTMAGLSSKGFYSGSQIVYPNSYKIQILPSQNKVINLISTGTSTNYIQQSILNLSGSNSSNICYINSTYKTVLSGEDIELEINKGSSNSQFNLSGISNKIILQTNLFICTQNGLDCKEIGQYIIDKRNQTITKKVCLSFTGNDCFQWNQ